MGTFDYVNFSTTCPNCKEELRDFQTKDLGCSTDNVEPDGLTCFYCSCPNCRLWIEYRRPSPPDHERRIVPLTEEEVLALGFVKSTQ